MTRRPAWVPALTTALLAALLAGCQGSPGDGPSDGRSAGTQEDGPPLQGWVFDEAVRPLAGVSVSVLERDATTRTDPDGHYVFTDLPSNQPLFIAAAHEGFVTQSKQVTLDPQLPSRLNFTLARVPQKTAYSTVVPFEGFLACQYAVVLAESEQSEDCSGGTNEDTFRFQVDADLAGAVIEVVWIPNNELASSLHAALRMPGGGEEIAEAVGEPILRLQVPTQFAASRLADGGELEVVVRVLPNVDEEEANSGVGVALNQEFQVFASLFYVEPPPPTYTIAE